MFSGKGDLNKGLLMESSEEVKKPFNFIDGVQKAKNYTAPDAEGSKANHRLQVSLQGIKNLFGNHAIYYRLESFPH